MPASWRRSVAGSGALDRVRAGVERLRPLTSPAELLAAAPRELCGASDLDRVVVSTVRDGMMVAAAVHVRDDPRAAEAALAALREAPVRLEHPVIEAELVRRRRAMIVEDARREPRVDRATSAIMGWDAYVAAPIAIRSSVVGVVHADRGPGRGLCAEHRDVLSEFADGLAQAYDTASLRRELRRERERMRGLLGRLGECSRELRDAPIELVPPPQTPSPRPEAVVPQGRPGLDGVLTRREIEILGMLAEGRTNRAIAAELVISPGTVKFHVNRILRKLRVANRAQAVSRYFALR